MVIGVTEVESRKRRGMRVEVGGFSLLFRYFYLVMLLYSRG